MKVDRTKAIIHLDNLVYNYNQLQKIAEDAEVMAVVKADAYGHGAIECARHLEANGCGYFAVASLAEAVELREAGIAGEILIFGRTDPENSYQLNKYNLTQTIYSYDYAKQLNATQEDIKIHILIDTGMSRFGIYLHDPQDLTEVISDVKDIIKFKYLKMRGIYTHFAVSDTDDDEFTQKQFQLFMKLLEILDKDNIKYGLTHAANSAGTLKFKNMHLNLVRCGIALYGYPPVETEFDFLPVMELVSRVSSIRTLQAGDTVSYGRKYLAKAKEKIATVAIGYADGYNRLLSNNDYFLFEGLKLDVLGTVCMDACMVRTNNSNIQEGDYVEIFGKEKNLEEITAKLNTITYEVLCGITNRVKREYIK